LNDEVRKDGPQSFHSDIVVLQRDLHDFAAIALQSISLYQTGRKHRVNELRLHVLIRAHESDLVSTAADLSEGIQLAVGWRGDLCRDIAGPHDRSRGDYALRVRGHKASRVDIVRGLTGSRREAHVVGPPGDIDRVELTARDALTGVIGMPLLNVDDVLKVKTLGFQLSQVFGYLPLGD